VEMWNKSADVVDGHYESGIPFKTDPPELLDNRVMAELQITVFETTTDYESGSVKAVH